MSDAYSNGSFNRLGALRSESELCEEQRGGNVLMLKSLRAFNVYRPRSGGGHKLIDTVFYKHTDTITSDEQSHGRLLQRTLSDDHSMHDHISTNRAHS